MYFYNLLLRKMYIFFDQSMVLNDLAQAILYFNNLDEVLWIVYEVA